MRLIRSTAETLLSRERGVQASSAAVAAGSAYGMSTASQWYQDAAEFVSSGELSARAEAGRWHVLCML